MNKAELSNIIILSAQRMRRKKDEEYENKKILRFWKIFYQVVCLRWVGGKGSSLNLGKGRGMGYFLRTKIGVPTASNV